MTIRYLRYLREECLPTVFCPGCGIGIVMKTLFTAFDELGIHNLNDYVFVSGIGCSAWIPSPHMLVDSIHTLHGRAIPIATGIKLVRPELNVIVVGGDGDIAGIGGNHLLHAARRNMDLLVIMINNQVYGMTGGQLAPTTPLRMYTTTTPYGNPEYPLDTCRILSNMAVNYIARWTVGHFVQLKNSFKKALSKNGFRFIEVITQCTSRVSSRIGLTGAGHIKEYLKRSVNIEKLENESNIDVDKIIVGEFVDRDLPSYLDSLREIYYGKS
jgi:2-oxoglutarate ferredoxin oxidoreductase subunit beta